MNSKRHKSFAPLRRFSQNFLVDDNVARKIVGKLQLTAGDLVVEIGPGTGSLTKLLVAQPIHCTSIELDGRAVVHLRELFAGASNLKLIEGDFLQFDFGSVPLHSPDATVKLVGNIPYSITSDIIFKFFESRKWISRAVIMMQKEVVDRLKAKVGSKEYGVLTIARELFGFSIDDCFNVSPTCFHPQPKVTSTVATFNRFSTAMDGQEEEIMRVVRMAFHQRRKTLRNALSSFLTEEGTDRIVETMGKETLSKRAENLAVADYIALSHCLRTPL